MTDLPVAAPLAAALTARGYATLTDVQSAMLAPEAATRDLLVSAQTGSGKTVAFGMAMAPDLLKGATSFLYADKPLALVIAPTRELALQVARELGWLYENTTALIATCVGGMDYRTEKRALDRGAHIVVGTPGRLRDHIERNSLDLSGIQAVVLDEADEMLDLGFQEDLEFILAASPPERRTLMFSATVPAEIEKLARTYQKDALRVAVQSATPQHADIQYISYSVASRDREHAIFNILRLHESPATLIFCKTRANVNHLLARMGNRGFQVVALSGELSQQERTHALQALRDGRARVCIATDVAARGIDLPGLELVIHADLPGSSETLLHRSGRTGRAGNKGISALIVTPAEYKKAQRLLQGAKVVANWEKPPSADEVQAKDDDRLLNHAALSEGPGDDAPLAAAILEKFGPEHVAGAFIRLWREGRSAPEVLMDSTPPPAQSGTPLPPRERGDFGASVWFVLSVGHNDRAEARWLLPKICEAGGITKTAIGAIRVKQDQSFVQIALDQAPKFGAMTELDTNLTMTRLEGEPDFDRSAAARPARPAPKPRVVTEDRAPHPVEEYTPRAAAERAPRVAKAYSPKPPRIVEDDEVAATPAWSPLPADAPAAAPKPYERKPYAPREAAAERKAYVKRDEGDAPRKPYVKREDSASPARAPYVKRDDAAAPRKPYVKREEGDAPRKPYVKRDDTSAAPRKPYVKRDDGDAPRKPYAPRDAAAAERKPYVKRDDASAPAKPWARREDPGSSTTRKPYVKRDDSAAPGERKPYVKRDDAAPTERKARWKDGDAAAKPRSAGFKSHGGRADAPGRAAGFKSHSAAAKPAYPARPKSDPTDTSKRFVPPKRPKS
jgi:ATP-dependent RNA helicase DeaD